MKEECFILQVSDSIGESVDSAISFLKEVWGKVEELVDLAKELYEKVKDLIKAGIELLAGLIDDILGYVKVTEVSFETSLKAAATAEIELGAKVKSTVYKIRAYLRSNLLEKVAEVVIEMVHKGYMGLKEGFIKAKGYINEMATKIGIVKKELDKAEQKKKTGNRRKRSYVPTEKELEIRRYIYDPLPRPELHDYETVKVFDAFEPNAYMSRKDSLPKVRVEKIEDNGPAKKTTINGILILYYLKYKNFVVILLYVFVAVLCFMN